MSEYFVQRGSRIYTVLVPALFVGALFDFWGATRFDTSGLYSNSAAYHTTSLETIIADNLSLGAFVGNLFMLEHIRFPAFGSNGPLWSLAYEWWYYCLFAVFLGMFCYRGAPRTICVFLTMVGLVMLPGKIILWSLVWLLGVATFFCVNTSIWRPRPVVGMLILIAGLILSRFNHARSVEQQFLIDFALGIAYSVFFADL